MASLVNKRTIDPGYLRSSLEELAKKWTIDPRIIEMLVGNRPDVRDTPIELNGVIFHIPTFTSSNHYVLWRCLWPDCHNCCEKQGRLPLTADDIEAIPKKLNQAKADFIKKETHVSRWTDAEPFAPVSTTFSMIALKRTVDETPEQDGKPLKCRFLDGKGYCGLHPDRPGCCRMYPFVSWTMLRDGKPEIHATFEFDGHCPGFYVSDSPIDMAEVLEDYAKRILEYNGAVKRTLDSGLGTIQITDLRPRRG